MNRAIMLLWAFGLVGLHSIVLAQTPRHRLVDPFRVTQGPTERRMLVANFASSPDSLIGRAFRDTLVREMKRVHKARDLEIVGPGAFILPMFGDAVMMPESAVTESDVRHFLGYAAARVGMSGTVSHVGDSLFVDARLLFWISDRVLVRPLPVIGSTSPTAAAASIAATTERLLLEFQKGMACVRLSEARKYQAAVRLVADAPRATRQSTFFRPCLLTAYVGIGSAASAARVASEMIAEDSTDVLSIIELANASDKLGRTAEAARARELFWRANLAADGLREYPPSRNWSSDEKLRAEWLHLVNASSWEANSAASDYRVRLGERLAKESPSSATVGFWRAEIQLSDNADSVGRSRTLRVATTAVEMYPSDAALNLLLSRAQWRAGDPVGGVETARRVLALGTATDQQREGARSTIAFLANARAAPPPPLAAAAAAFARRDFTNLLSNAQRGVQSGTNADSLRALVIAFLNGDLRTAEGSGAPSDWASTLQRAIDADNALKLVETKAVVGLAAFHIGFDSLQRAIALNSEFKPGDGPQTTVCRPIFSADQAWAIARPALTADSSTDRRAREALAEMDRQGGVLTKMRRVHCVPMHELRHLVPSGGIYPQSGRPELGSSLADLTIRS